MGRWLERYKRGDRVGVWTEMTSLGPAIDADNLPEAFVVVQETMGRVRQNVERLVEALPGLGYVFDQAADEPPFEPPEPDIDDMLDQLEARVGRLPLSLHGWYQHVGRVNLMGSQSPVGLRVPRSAGRRCPGRLRPVRVRGLGRRPRDTMGPGAVHH